MPSHPDRVRRSYHDIVVKEYENLATMEHHIAISISKRHIASMMSAHEVKRELWRMIERGVDSSYRLAEKMGFEPISPDGRRVSSAVQYQVMRLLQIVVRPTGVAPV